MSSEPDKLAIKTGKGEVRQLVLLRGAPVEVEALPAVLDSGLSEKVKIALEEGTLNLEQEANSGSAGSCFADAWPALSAGGSILDEAIT